MWVNLVQLATLAKLEALDQKDKLVLWGQKGHLVTREIQEHQVRQEQLGQLDSPVWQVSLDLKVNLDFRVLLDLRVPKEVKETKVPQVIQAHKDH